METKNKVLSVIWDFDGTIADSRQKNYNVTKKIVKKILGRDPREFSVLISLEEYHFAHTKVVNWREFYKKSFGMSEDQVDEAGRLWTGFQLDDKTPVPLINGVEDTIKSMREFPQGIVSQNSRDNIIGYLEEKNILRYFQTVVGYEEVHLAKQKPHPDGLIICLNRLVDSESGYVFYIGDHETDVQCVRNTNDVLKNKKMKVKIISIGAFYGFDIDTTSWKNLPDYEATSADRIKSLVENFMIDAK